MSSEYIIHLEGISKTYPGVKALDEVSFELKEGEVLALCGENGAGKSTLMKTIAGVHAPDPGSGDIWYMGEKVNFSSPLEAKKAGIILIFQELSLVPELTVAENIFLGSLPRSSYKTINWKLMNQQTAKLLEELECNFKPTDLAGNLSIAQQQMVEIARALPFKPKVVILDEPTSSLTEREKEVLFKNIRRLKEKGVAIVYITHKMDEVFDITDRITVLRDGKRTGTLETANATISDITSLMIGRTMEDFFHKSKAIPGPEILRVEGLSRRGEFENISFSIRSGEVLGIYGLVGAGRSEVAESILGVRKLDNGKIFIEGEAVTIRNSKDAVSKGIGFVPENRKEQGLVLKMSCKDNTSLAKLPWMHHKGFIDRKADNETFDEYKEKLLISTPGPQQQVVLLSGGNQQKIVIAKWMCIGPKILILDEPTRGIDVGAKAEIHKLIAKMAEAGLAVLVISSEMPEIMGVSNRIITMKDGRITGEFREDEVTEKCLIDSITLDPVEVKTCDSDRKKAV
jgi:ABC-type sugar transport system ATPase subunit